MGTSNIILLVDDDAYDRYLFQEAVKDKVAQYQVMIAGNGSEALELLEKLADLPDMIFMDVNMPIMNGVECLQHIKSHELYRNIPIVIISTADHNGIEKKVMQLGAEGFSCKPVSFDELADMICHYLNASSSHP